LITVEIESNVTVRIGDHVHELTLDELRTLKEKIDAALGVQQPVAFPLWPQMPQYEPDPWWKPAPIYPLVTWSLS
jgi:hypothetical protein